MERAAASALAALLVGGCGLVLDVGPSSNGAPAPEDDGGAGQPDGGGVVGGDAAADDATACVPAREACNGIDDDCDGDTDEHCDCARYVLAGATGAGAAPDDPIGTIGAAIESLAGMAGKVCVGASASGGECTATTYTESVVMADGISVLGGFRAGPTAPWDRGDRSCETIIVTDTQDGVRFGDAVGERTTLDGFTVRAGPDAGDVAAITVEGAGTISNNTITGKGGTSARGIRLVGCGERTTRIVGNRRIVGATAGPGAAYGIEVTDCSVLVERNGEIVGRVGGDGREAAGIACVDASTCTVVGNGAIVGVESGASATMTYGVWIETAAGSVLGNGPVAGCRGPASSGCQGIAIVRAVDGALVDGNVVEPGNGEWNAGIRVVHTVAMVSNNLVTVGSGNGIDVGLDPTGARETTVHSNTVVTHAGDSAPARLLFLDLEGASVGTIEPSGIFRNNIAVCLGGPGPHASFAESTITTPPPRVLENNDLFGCATPYLRGNGTALVPGELAPGLATSSVSGNLGVDPLFVDAAGGDYHLSSASPLIDSGTSSGPAPEHDFDGDARMQGRAPDIGFDETNLTRP